MTQMEDDWRHPELQPGEVFVSNMTRDEFEEFPYASKRMGEFEYDSAGHRLPAPDSFPVFIAAAELAEHPIDLATLRRLWRKIHETRGPTRP